MNHSEFRIFRLDLCHYRHGRVGRGWCVRVQVHGSCAETVELMTCVGNFDMKSDTKLNGNMSRV